MHEIFIHGGNSNDYVLRSDTVDLSGLKGDTSECFTTMNPNNYEDILERLAQNRTVSVCSDRCLLGRPEQEATPETLASRILTYKGVPKLFGGFRRVTRMDLIHAAAFRAYKAYEFARTFEECEGALADAEVLSETHPLAEKLEFTGLNIYHTVLYMAFLFDPRRFVNPTNTKDKSYYYSYTLAREGVNVETLELMKTDEEFEPTSLPEIVWSSLMWCWAPPLGDIALPEDDAPDKYWARRYFDHYHRCPPNDIRDRYARVQVTREVGDYILELWFDALGVEPAFNPSGFFKYPSTTAAYIHRFGTK